MSKQMGKLRLWLHQSLCGVILSMQKFLHCFKDSLSCSISIYCLKAVMLFGCVFCNAEPICIEYTEDYAILDQFFRMTFSEEEYGYVLEGSKPISLRNFMALDDFPISKDFNLSEKEFNNTLLVHQAIPIWNKLCSHQNHFVLKAVALSDQVSPLLSTLELSFINIPKLKEVVDKNIDLFRYILGPSNTAQDIIDSIVYSDQPLINNLKYDLSLLGVVLGFGSHNSIVGGRLETILALSISKDHPPFTPQSCLMQGKAAHSLDFLTPDRYGTYYLELAGGDDAYFRVDLPRLEKHSSYANLEEEVQSIDKLVEPLPQSLWKLPRFVFGAFKGGPSNQPFFKHLQKTQIKIRALLKKSDFLEYILEKISGKRPVIRVKKTSLVSERRIPIEIWSEILRKAAARFENKERKLAFIKAFCNPTDSSRMPPEMMGASVAGLEGLKIARSNLVKADKRFERLSQDTSLKTIVPKRLYFKTTFSGNGKELKGEDRVRIGYVIEDQEGEILFANHDSWLHLSLTIPGFAHGVQGMHLQEKRTLFIHPTLGYGVLTTLPPCSTLVVKVHLLDIDAQASRALPSLTPLDLSWVQESSLYEDIEESLKQQPCFVGSFYRNMLDKAKQLDRFAFNDSSQKYHPKKKLLGADDLDEMAEKKLKTFLESYF